MSTGIDNFNSADVVTCYPSTINLKFSDFKAKYKNDPVFAVIGEIYVMISQFLHASEYTSVYDIEALYRGRIKHYPENFIRFESIEALRDYIAVHQVMSG